MRFHLNEERKRTMLTFVDNFLTVILIIILSLNVAIYLLNKIALGFMEVN